jgi:hypothetical protein
VPQVNRIVAAVAALLVVGGTLVVGWHRATVTHGVCVEHGDELHLERVADHERASADGVARMEASTWEVRDGDHHCQVAATSRTAVAVGDDPTVSQAPPASVDQDLPHTVARASAVALLRIAPKTSPPA